MTHTPVMVKEVLHWLGGFRKGVVIDGTLGLGGHTRALLECSDPGLHVVGFERDPETFQRAMEYLKPFSGRFHGIRANYSSFDQYGGQWEGRKVVGFLLDLGISSMQLDSQGRGFSFSDEKSLDMRVDRTENRPTAEEIINHLPEKDLADLFYKYGEERHSRRIARQIVRRRRMKPFETGKELGDYISRFSGPARGQAIHPATRIFQALRIYINQELDHLSKALESSLKELSIGGRIVTIAFHSLEDRIIKRFMYLHSGRCYCPPELPACACKPDSQLRIHTRRPHIADPNEVDENPRARSAKLRCAERISQDAQ